MLNYSIKDLEYLSGIKAHTIRIWERRYNLLIPNRSDTNIRSYSDAMLKKILNVSTLVNSGYKISKVSQMSDELLLQTINHLIHEPVGNDNVENHIRDLINICISLDSEGLDRKFKEIIAQRDLEYTFEYVFVPLLQRIGHLWITDMFSPSHEHFLSNKIKEVLFGEIAKTKIRYDKKFLLFLPQWEEHEIVLLFCNYLLRKEGYKTVYLGCKVPHRSLQESIAVLKPDYIVTHLTAPNQTKYFEEYMKIIPNAYKVSLSGNKEYKPMSLLKDHVSWVENLKEFKTVTFV